MKLTSKHKGVKELNKKTLEYYRTCLEKNECKNGVPFFAQNY